MFKSKFLSGEQGNRAWPFFDIRVSSYMVMRRMLYLRIRIQCKHPKSQSETWIKQTE